MITESELKEIKGGVNWVIVGVGGSGLNGSERRTGRIGP